MSDSSLSDGPPSAATLEQALRNAVQSVYRKGNLEDLTVKRIRRAAEVDLGLEEDFYKSNAAWKDRSKNIISAEVDAHADADHSSQQPASAHPTPQKGKPLPARHQKPESKAKGVKRKSTGETKPKKRRKKDTSDEEVSDFEAEAVEEAHSSPKVKKPRATSTLSPPPSEEVDNGQQASSRGKSKFNDAEPDQSDSEMSVLIDEPSKKSKGRPKKSDSAKSERAAPKKRKSTEEPVDPDQEEIKRLQGWLVKCGIRKMWWKELQPFDTSKAKIKHLKGMLSDAGMTGRYSQEKATQIREERELKADLEAVQEGAKIWGKEEDEEEEAGAGGRPKRQVARGLQGLDFLNDSDGEETD